MKILLLFFIITAALGLCACSSQDRRTSVAPTSTPSTGNCYQTAVTDSDLNKCAIQTAEATHVELNALVNELHDHMEAVQYHKFVNIQSEWEKIAKEHCQWKADFFAGGSIQPMWLAGCLDQQYHQRIEALRFDLCEGHGMTGQCEAASKYK